MTGVRGHNVRPSGPAPSGSAPCRSSLGALATGLGKWRAGFDTASCRLRPSPAAFRLAAVDEDALVKRRHRTTGKVPKPIFYFLPAGRHRTSPRQQGCSPKP